MGANRHRQYEVVFRRHEGNSSPPLADGLGGEGVATVDLVPCQCKLRISSVGLMEYLSIMPVRPAGGIFHLGGLDAGGDGSCGKHVNHEPLGGRGGRRGEHGPLRPVSAWLHRNCVLDRQCCPLLPAMRCLPSGASYLTERSTASSLFTPTAHGLTIFTPPLPYFLSKRSPSANNQSNFLLADCELVKEPIGRFDSPRFAAALW